MPRITELYAFVVADKNPEDEGIVGCRGQNGYWMPLVGADMTRVDALKPIADQIATALKKPYKILKFKLVEEQDGSNPSQ